MRNRAGAASPPPHCADWRTAAFPPPPAALHAGEIGLGHVNLAAHVEHARRLACEHMRDFGDGADIGGDILALVAIAARRRVTSMPSSSATSRTVRRSSVRRPSAAARYPPSRETSGRGRKTRRPPGGEIVVERQHGNAVRDLGEFFRRRGPDLEAWGFRARTDSGCARFERLELSAQGVIGGIADRGRVFGMVAPVVLRDFDRERPVRRLVISGFG